MTARLTPPHGALLPPPCVLAALAREARTLRSRTLAAGVAGGLRRLRRRPAPLPEAA